MSNNRLMDGPQAEQAYVGAEAKSAGTAQPPGHPYELAQREQHRRYLRTQIMNEANNPAEAELRKQFAEKIAEAMLLLPKLGLNHERHMKAQEKLNGSVYWVCSTMPYHVAEAFIKKGEQG